MQYIYYLRNFHILLLTDFTFPCQSTVIIKDEAGKPSTL